MKHQIHCDLFPFVIFKREYRQGCLQSRVHLFNKKKEMDFFSFSILFCAVSLVTVLLMFQKATINNNFISKEVFM